VTWGKVDKDTYQQATESMQADYSTLMPFIVKALLENRARYEQQAKEIGSEALFTKEPQAKGYLRPKEGYRLFSKRAELVTRLDKDVSANRDWLMDSIHYLVA
jgi:deoxyhypusine synthase